MAAGPARVALVSGASRGIGRATARLLADAGMAVALGYRSDADGARETAGQIVEAGGRAAAVPLDVADEASIGAAFDAAQAELGAVTVLVNNAGFTRDGLAVRYSTGLWDATVDTNLKGAFLCTRRALPAMLKARWGRVVNVASAAALRGNPGQAAYAASKSGLVGLTRSLAREVGGRGITVNAICPGFVDTRMTEAQPPEIKQRYVDMTPAGRFGTPEEVAAVIAFLAGDGAAYVNGAVIAVDGGLTA
jgi:3-oxoacyl-[acyl-carrier protein] reductase